MFFTFYVLNQTQGIALVLFALFARAPCRSLLRCSRVALGASWGLLGALGSLLGRSWVALGCRLGALGGSWWSLGSLLGASRGLLQARGSLLGRSLVALGCLLGAAVVFELALSHSSGAFRFQLLRFGVVWGDPFFVVFDKDIN